MSQVGPVDPQPRPVAIFLVLECAAGIGILCSTGATQERALGAGRAPCLPQGCSSGCPHGFLQLCWLPLPCITQEEPLSREGLPSGLGSHDLC